jgi:hypothetical protein
MKLALHACCGPCLLEPHDALVAEAEEIVVVYANPNIHPIEEYERRRDTLIEYAADRDITVVELPYEPALWLERVGVHARDRERRCRACYALRIGLVSQWAAEHGFDAVATTLTVSPYQDPVAITEEGMAAAEAFGLDYLATDFRERYQEATRRSRDVGMYRQNYCGCLLSDAEAREQRAERRARRAKPKSG